MQNFDYEQLMAEHEDKERQIILDRLFTYKPWLKTCVPKLKQAKPDFIIKNYPLEESDITEFEKIMADSGLKA